MTSIMMLPQSSPANIHLDTSLIPPLPCPTHVLVGPFHRRLSHHEVHPLVHTVLGHHTSRDWPRSHTGARTELPAACYANVTDQLAGC